VFRGAENDVAGRALGCARSFGLTRFARICGDRPFFDPTVVGRLIGIMSDTGCDVATTMFPRTLPPGLTAEVVATQALARMCEATEAAYDREHMTAYFYRNPRSFWISNFNPAISDDLDGLRLVVDDESDLERARAIVAQLPGPAAVATTNKIAHLARAWDHQSRFFVREDAKAR
jgi:spore coat polysaccharide biosynthesis protein SpsF